MGHITSSPVHCSFSLVALALDPSRAWALFWYRLHFWRTFIPCLSGIGVLLSVPIFRPSTPLWKTTSQSLNGQTPLAKPTTPPTAAMDDLDMQAYKLLVDPTPPTLRGSRPVSKMKPNTRFLSHIVREAKSHNAALLARETADAQKRLKRLIRKDGEDGVNSGDEKDDKDERGYRRRRRDRTGESTRRDDDRHRRRRRHGDDEGERNGERRDKHSSSHRHRGSHHRSGSRHRESSREDREREREKKNRDRESRSKRHHDRDRDREEGETDKDRSSPNRKHQERSDSLSRRSRRRSASPRPSKYRRRDRDRDSDRERERTRHRSPYDSSGRDESDYSSDPLDEFVGPKLASDRLGSSSNESGVHIRGRGTLSSAASGFATSSMDRHFAADYGPSNDVEHPLPQPRPQVAPRLSAIPSSKAADDAGTEMQEDRKQLLGDNTERLKAAGFTDKEIAILSRGGRRRLDNSPWAKKGEAREWDRDKVEGNDGPVKPVWAR